MGQPLTPVMLPDVAWWVPDSWQEVSVIVGIFLGVVTVGLSVLAALRSHRKADDSAAARDQAVDAKEVTVAAKDEIAWQFHPNHGSSMRDAVDRIEETLATLTAQVGTIAVDVAGVKSTVTAQGEQLRHGTESIAEIRRDQTRHLQQHIDGGRKR